MGRHVEIAGAGFAGLALGGMLARRGWSVTIHERSADIREIGAGIFIHNNGLLVLEELGLMDQLADKGVPLTYDRKMDHRGRPMHSRHLVGPARTWSFPRQALIQALYAYALESGATVLTSSYVVAARSDGVLVTEDGAEHRADLVVGADGYQSSVRRSLGLTRIEQKLSTTSIRYLLPNRDLSPDDITTENWSGKRRIAVAACGPGHTYSYLACPAADIRGSDTPLDVESWSEWFPHLRPVLERLHAEEAYTSRYSLVDAESWSAGSVALVGDSAHSLAPTLGQGTNLALCNARSLVTFLAPGDGDIATAAIPERLRRWEQAVRPVTEATQVWAGRYDKVTKRWPDSLVPLRRVVIWAFGVVPSLDRRLRVAERTAPVQRLPQAA